MADFNPNVSIITLNVKGLNIPIKRQGLFQWIKNKAQLHIVYKRAIFLVLKSALPKINIITPLSF